MATKVWQQPLPEIYTQLSDAELRLRIEAAPVDLAVSALEGRWAVERSGDALVVRATRAEAPEVVRRLVGAGAELFQIVPEQRNLEEVFLSITQPEAV